MRCLCWFVILMAMLGVGCERQPTVAPQPLVVRCAPAQEARANAMSATPAYMAAVKADNETELSFKIGGTIELIGPREDQDWTEGLEVKKGAVLAQIKQSDLVNAVKSARAKFELDRKQYERNRKLLADGAISQQEFDTADAGRQAADAALAQAEQAVRDSVLRAPFDGTILSRMASSGETALPGKPCLRFGDLNHMTIELGAPDHLLNRIKVGMEIPVIISTLEGRSFKGRVSEVGVAAKEGARLLKIELKVANPDRRIKSGMSASVPLEESAPTAASVMVPLSALVTAAKDRAPDQLAVFVVENHSVARERMVQTGDIVGSSIIISEGVNAGESVVVAGASSLYDGAPVHPQPSKW